MSHSSFAFDDQIPVQLCHVPAVRLVAEALMWLGGGVAFAATVGVLVSLPGLID